MALGTMRTPDIIESLMKFNSGVIEKMMRSMYASMDDVVEQLREDEDWAGKTQAELESEARLMVAIAHQEGVVKTDDKWAVGMAIKMAMEIAPIFAGRDWVVVHRDNEAKSFITTDAPLVLTTVAPRAPSIWGVGFGNVDALVIFPLTQSCALKMFGNSGGFRHQPADRDQVRQINLGLASHCGDADWGFPRLCRIGPVRRFPQEQPLPIGDPPEFGDQHRDVRAGIAEYLGTVVHMKYGIVA